jgi:hypothetical protein
MVKNISIHDRIPHLPPIGHSHAVDCQHMPAQAVDRDGIKVKYNFDWAIGSSLLSSSQSLGFHEIDVAMNENLRARVFI